MVRNGEVKIVEWSLWLKFKVWTTSAILLKLLTKHMHKEESAGMSWEHVHDFKLD